MPADASEENDKGYGIRAVDRVCDLLDTLSMAQSPVSLVELAAACGLPKTSAFRYLATLEARHYVERVGDAPEYRLGMAFVSLQANHLEALTEKARSVLQQIRDEFEETTNLGVLVGNAVTYLDIVESPRSVRLAMRRGDHDAIHCTALGKAIISRLPDTAVVDLIGTKYERRTIHTNVSWPQLRDELARIRRQGYAVDDEENEIGGRCVAVNLPGTVKAAISLSAPAARLPKARTGAVGKRLIEAAEEIMARLN